MVVKSELPLLRRKESILWRRMWNSSMIDAVGFNEFGTYLERKEDNGKIDVRANSWALKATAEISLAQQQPRHRLISQDHDAHRIHFGI